MRYCGHGATYWAKTTPTLATRNNLAAVLRRMGRWEEAENPSTERFTDNVSDGDTP